MALWTHRIVGFFDLALFVNHVTNALGIARLGIIARAVGESDSTCGVAKERVGELVFVRKGGVFSHRVETDA